ncbi:MAG: ATP-dependent DNA helicase, partial [Oscillospiraceae bacterium]|nr:ATP-dependent DNA helicase [Oscillospiraceae bacterium]
MKEIINISCRDLVEFIFKSGSINNLFQSMNKRNEGILIHKKIQNSYAIEEFSKEVTLSYEIEYDDFILRVSGRADGIWKNLFGYKIEEIKSTSFDLKLIDENFYNVHLAQAKVYGYIFSKNENLDKIDIKLTYYNVITEDIKIFEFNFSAEDLTLFFNELIDKYLKWVYFFLSWRKIRNQNLKNLEFPFKEYRKGQRDFAIRVYNAIKNSKKLFCEAPTGIGKTISTIFPSLKSMSEGYCDRIFYLTSKNTTSKIAEEAILNINKKGDYVKFIKITAKEKICSFKECTCNPESCPYTLNYFDKINDVVFEIINNHTSFTTELIEIYSKKYSLCPFELTLDLSNYADFIICDYNYLFDPRVYLKRFFENVSERYVFLIDECHNLIDRAREMYSSEISKKEILEGKKLLKYVSPKSINALNKKLIEYKKLLVESDHFIFKEEEEDLYILVSNVVLSLEEALSKLNPSIEKDTLLNLYFNLVNFLKISEIYDENCYVTYCSNTLDDFIFKLYCIDPCKFIKKCYKKAVSSILFSATLMPLDYHIDLLGKDEDDVFLRLPSPFSPLNRKIIVCSNIDLRFNNRNSYVQKISDYINTATSAKEGNYLVFSPSYEYMKLIYEDFTNRYPHFNTMIQIQNQDERSREDFLNFFKENPVESHIGFSVLGGVFSEGIDLKYDRLIGAIIISVGIPKINFERDMIRDFYENKNSKGYLYAYTYPGIIKVFQASGRVIRTLDDKGIILLIDDRYTYSVYKKLFPSHYNPYSIIAKDESL